MRNVQRDGVLQAPQRGRGALVPGQGHTQQAAHSCAQQGALPPLLGGAAAQGLREGAGRALPCVNAAPAHRNILNVPRPQGFFGRTDPTCSPAGSSITELSLQLMIWVQSVLSEGLCWPRSCAREQVTAVWMSPLLADSAGRVLPVRGSR